jgi:hypothetical protein
LTKGELAGVVQEPQLALDARVSSTELVPKK